jgi:hypothetical protein
MAADAKPEQDLQLTLLFPEKASAHGVEPQGQNAPRLRSFERDTLWVDNATAEGVGPSERRLESARREIPLGHRVDHAGRVLP